MLRVVFDFGKSEVWRRLPVIVSSSHFWVSFILALLIVRYFEFLFTLDSFTKLMEVIISYSSIVMGFSIGCISALMTFSDRDFVSKLVSIDGEEEISNAFVHLIFIFTWTAVLHWIMILGAFSFFTAKPALILLKENFKYVAGMLIFLYFWVSSYAFFQFLIQIITMLQVSRVYANRLKNAGKSKPTQPAN